MEFEEAAVLLTSELVTNALLHARSAPELTVRLVVGRLRVSVSDATPVAPARKHYGTEAGTGRGLMLIETMASSWGSDASPDGKVVWFELASADDGRPAATAEARPDSPTGASDCDLSRRPTRRARPGSGPASSSGPSARAPRPAQRAARAQRPAQRAAAQP